MADRLQITVDPKDTIFPMGSIIENLGNDIPVKTLDLGRHEFPFNSESLDNRKFGEIASDIRKSYAPVPKYRQVFRNGLRG